MAKGAVSKESVTNQILQTFAGSFVYGKEIRIPMQEDGNDIQIKVVLTCAKDNVEPGADTAVPGAVENGSFPPPVEKASSESSPVKVTAAEQDAVSNLMAELGI